MTIPELIAHVDESIARALNHDSAIDQEILTLAGFSTGIQRRLMSNLCHQPTDYPSYLECGLWKGASFCAAINNNPKLCAYGIENFSQAFHANNVKEELLCNVARFEGGCRSVKVKEQDCFAVALSSIVPPVTVFSFDSEHTYAAHRKALSYFLPAMADTFCFVVDDYDWYETVQKGTKDGLKDLEGLITIHKQWHLTDGIPDGYRFHNGIFIAVISKR